MAALKFLPALLIAAHPFPSEPDELIELLPEFVDKPRLRAVAEATIEDEPESYILDYNQDRAMSYALAYARSTPVEKDGPTSDGVTIYRNILREFLLMGKTALFAPDGSPLRPELNLKQTADKDASIPTFSTAFGRYIGDHVQGAIMDAVLAYFTSNTASSEDDDDRLVSFRGEVLEAGGIADQHERRIAIKRAVERVFLEDMMRPKGSQIFGMQLGSSPSDGNPYAPRVSIFDPKKGKILVKWLFPVVLRTGDRYCDRSPGSIGKRSNGRDYYYIHITGSQSTISKTPATEPPPAATEAPEADEVDTDPVSNGGEETYTDTIEQTEAPVAEATEAPVAEAKGGRGRK